MRYMVHVPRHRRPRTCVLGAVAAGCLLAVFASVYATADDADSDGRSQTLTVTVDATFGLVANYTATSVVPTDHKFECRLALNAAAFNNVWTTVVMSEAEGQDPAAVGLTNRWDKVPLLAAATGDTVRLTVTYRDASGVPTDTETLTVAIP